MKLIKNSFTEKPIKIKPGHFLKVGDMLKYIKSNKIPTNAEVVVEHVEDIYLLTHSWSHYKFKDEDTDTIMLPIHNGFGWIDNKKYFALWMHY